VSTDGSYNNTDFITDTGPTSATKILKNLDLRLVTPSHGMDQG
jgi:hypothetical protein